MAGAYSEERKNITNVITFGEEAEMNGDSITCYCAHKRFGTLFFSFPMVIFIWPGQVLLHTIRVLNAAAIHKNIKDICLMFGQPHTQQQTLSNGVIRYCFGQIFSFMFVVCVCVFYTHYVGDSCSAGSVIGRVSIKFPLIIVILLIRFRLFDLMLIRYV